MLRLRTPLCALAAVLLASAANAGSIQTVDGLGDTFTLSFNGIVDTPSPTVMPGLTADATFTVTGFSYDGSSNVTTLEFDILIDNTSDATIWQSAVVTSIGFDTDPNALTGVSTGVFNDFVTGGSFPTGAGFAVEYCASNNAKNCNGPGNTPLNVGQSGTATVTMTFAGNVSQLDFSNFGIRWQALDSSVLGISGGSGIGAETPPIPEPTAAAVFALGALIVGAALRRKLN